MWSASKWATFRFASCGVLELYLPGPTWGASKLHTGAPIQTTYALQTPPACQVRPCAPQWRAHPHPSHLPGRQTRRCPPRPGEKELQTLGRLSHLSVTDRCESPPQFGSRLEARKFLEFGSYTSRGRRHVMASAVLELHPIPLLLL